MDELTILCLAMIGALAYLILWREGMFYRHAALFASAGLILAAMLLRGVCLDHETLDYQNFLTRWVGFFRENGGFRALKESVGNYNVPYLYLLALISYSSTRDLYLIKLFSILFDVLLAWGVLRVGKRLWPHRLLAGLAGFLVTLFLPTVVLNGAYWGQCDSVYTAFGLWSVVFALEEKPWRSVAAAALSFAFKLQAVFFLPMLLIFLFARKIKWYHLAAFPVTYVLAVLPAVLAGRPFLDTLTLYLDQAGTVGSALNYNSASLYAFAPRDAADPEGLARKGIAAAFVLLLLLYVLCFFRRKKLDDRALLACCLLVSVGVPLLLPHMHDRYFFPADLLSLCFALAFPPLSLVPALVSFASLTGYHAYLLQKWMFGTSDSLRYGALALTAAFCAGLGCLLARLFSSGRKSEKSG